MDPVGNDISDVYAAYRASVVSLYEGDPGHKSVAQRLAHGLPEGLRRPGFMVSLYASMDSRNWKEPRSTSRSNWLWRTGESMHSPDRAEVALEREIVSRGGRQNWSYQMSTMSGIFDPRTHQRRAIDLVHQTGPTSFDLIELERGSDNPVFAAFEILGCGLAYCHARSHAEIHASRSEHDVLGASVVRLVVLAPSGWYQFNLRGEHSQRFPLRELSSALNDGLQHLQSELALPGLDELAFEYREFADRESLLHQVSQGQCGGTLLPSQAE